MNHCFAKTEIYALELEILFANIFTNQHLFKTTLDTKLFNPFLHWTRHVMWLFGNCPQTSTFCNIVRLYLRQISNIPLFSLNLWPLWNEKQLTSMHWLSELSLSAVKIFTHFKIERTTYQFLIFVFLRTFYAVGLPMSRQDQMRLVYSLNFSYLATYKSSRKKNQVDFGKMICYSWKGCPTNLVMNLSRQKLEMESVRLHSPCSSS